MRRNPATGRYESLRCYLCASPEGRIETFGKIPMHEVCRYRYVAPYVERTPAPLLAVDYAELERRLQRGTIDEWSNGT